MTRVIVVGSGLAGLTAALRAHAAGAEVTVVTKAGLGEGNSAYAQGGIAAAVGDGDSPASHLRDTLTAGAGTVDVDAAHALVAAGPAVIADLVAAGVAFDRDADGALRLGLEGAHSAARILHAGGDATGAAIQRALVDGVRRAGIPVREHAFLVDLVVEGGRVRGVELIEDERRVSRDADAVILATGGAGRLFAHTTNPTMATADGIAAALRAGAVVADLEFVQFHPTTLADGTLVSEAVRGEGAVLRDESGHRFALDAHPAGELAPRDVVARAIARAMAAQEGRPVVLDATHLGGPEFLAQRFPTVDAAVRARGWDWSREPVPVSPGAHYLMGGVVTDLDGRTSLPGLWAAGEVARTGVHGANRLASNSLLEAAVFGARAGVSAAGVALAPAARDTDQGATDRGAADPTLTVTPPAIEPVAGVRPSAPPFSRTALQQLMWAQVGLVRDAAGLEDALQTLRAWDVAFRGAPASTPEECEDRNLLTVAVALTAAALRRTASLGAHHRADDPGSATADALVEAGTSPVPDTVASVLAEKVA